VVAPYKGREVGSGIVPSNKHVHKYELGSIGIKGTYFVYACVLPRCTHYIAQRLAVNKETICWRCGDVTLVPRQRPGKRGIKHPICVKCIKRRAKDNGVNINLDKLESMTMEELLGDETAGLFDFEDEE
jgi:hypothetical protein